MANLNKVLLIGRLTRDPELRYIQSGSAVTEFGLATNREWTTPQGELLLNQEFQMVTGVLTAGGKGVPLANGKLRGDQITFTAGGVEYAGKVSGDRIEGTVAADGKRQAWTATRTK